MNELEFISSNTNKVFILGVGVLGIFLIITALGAIVSNLVARWFRGNSGSRRSDESDGWPDRMLLKLDNIELNTALMSTMFQKNGYARTEDVEEIKRMLRTCQTIHEKERV